MQRSDSLNCVDKIQLSNISKTFLFNGMDTDKVTSYIKKCDVLSYDSGDVIHSCQRTCGGIGILLSGGARIISGNGDTLLRILKCGDVFGAASAFSIGETNRTKVISSGNSTVLIVPVCVIDKIIESDPTAAKRYIAFLSDRINFLNSRISALTAGDAVAKTAGFILSLETDENGNAVISDSFTNVASRLNMGRASLYRTIDKFETDGLVKRNKDTITILNRDGLEDIIFKKRTR